MHHQRLNKRRLSPRGLLILLFVSQCLVSLSPLWSQDLVEKRPLQHEDYAKWNTISSNSLSNNGDWVSYIVKPGKGDATLHVRHNRSAQEYKILRGQSARFSFDSQRIFYVVAADPELIKKLKKEKKPAEELPKPHLEILNLKTGKKATYQNVTSYSIPEKSVGWIAFKKADSSKTLDAKKSPSPTTEKYVVTPQGLKRPSPTKKGTGKKEGNQSTKSKPKSSPKSTAGKQKPSTPPAKTDSKKKNKPNGTTLVLLELDSGEEFRFPLVNSFGFNETGTLLGFSTSGPKPEDDGLSIFDLKSKSRQQLLSGQGNYSSPYFDKSGSQVAFLTNRDDYSHDQPEWSIFYWKKNLKQAIKIVDSKTKGMPEKWWAAKNGAPRFTENGQQLVVRTAPVPADRDSQKPDAKAKEEEDKAKLDIWHWQDPFLQPQQLLRAESERNRAYAAIYDMRSRKFIQLATKDIPSVSVDLKSTAGLAIGNAPDAYNKLRSWDYPSYSDYYLINLQTGQADLAVKRTRGRPSLSPDGKFMTWWDGDLRAWFGLATSAVTAGGTLSPINLSKDIPYPVFNELHDSPSVPGSYRSAGWLAGDAGFLIYDRWDIWQIDPTGKSKPVNLTGGYGRKNLIQLRRINLDPEARSIKPDEPMILSGLDHKTKASGFLKWEPGKDPKVAKLIWLNESLSSLRKAKSSNDVTFTRSTFQRFPDIWSSKLGVQKTKSKAASNSGFQSIQRISHANPQQSEYAWGSAELTHWKSKDGQPLDGILYKPEGFDPQKKYPMIVYFYERYSDRLHSHYPPAAGRSIINFSFYVSRGYVVFVPDIPYRVGEPGPSAKSAILPGVEHVIAQGFVDRKRIGMQGHSWGGYQSAYLVTQTDLFACVESGAPVSNMTSAYGGIRWGSGMSRMFQYEKTQSRIGESLWKAREKYIANSPLFFADRINTPMLILHNDKDTAVPWYQGIELFVALRRLEKPAWMLNYNGDPHWVMGDANRMDFAKRMQQFFDHYLKGDPMPEWMANGIPAVDKGKKFGFEPAKVKK